MSEHVSHILQATATSTYQTSKHHSSTCDSTKDHRSKYHNTKYDIRQNHSIAYHSRLYQNSDYDMRKLDISKYE